MGDGSMLPPKGRRPDLGAAKGRRVAPEEETDMSTISRRTFVHGAAASVGTFAILTDRAKGAEVDCNFRHDCQPTHQMNVRANEMLPKTLEESGGRLEVR